MGVGMSTAGRRRAEAAKYKWYVRITYKNGKVDEFGPSPFSSAYSARDHYAVWDNVAKAEVVERK